MAYGANYSVNPEIYSEVAAFSTRNTSIPSGASIVRGIYYMWNESGFTGNGWMHDVDGGPTNVYGFTSDDEVAAYVAEKGNLDAVFSYWAQHYTLEGWDNFYTKVGVDSGCMDVDHSGTGE